MLHALFCESAFVWWRFQLVLEQWPFRLLLWSRHSYNSWIVHVFFHVKACCLDDAFSLKLRSMYPSADAMIKGPHARRMLQLWGKGSTVTNMHVERLLAAIKRSGGDITPYL
eukprot:8561985-Pyramimonas_sp.AAC.1